MASPGNDARLTIDDPSDGDDLEFWRIRGLRFRVLILGRANAGKTTILERLTGASEDEAQVYRNGVLLQGQVFRVRFVAILGVINSISRL
jgi:GTPase SAR1 family protein